MKAMKTPRKVVTAKPDEIDRAVARIESAVGRLARLMYTDDSQFGAKVGNALAAVGEFAAGPVSRAVSRAPRPEQRMALLYVLEAIYWGRDLSVGDRMLRIYRNDPDERVRQLAASVLTNPAVRKLAGGGGNAAADSRRS